MVWGGALGLVPADSKIIKVEKALKIDPTAQLLASIMSKKLAVGSKYILIDIPYGKGSKVSRNKALDLKRKFLKLGKYFKRKIEVVLTKGDEPIGFGVGPALEMIDVINILNPEKKGPKDLEKKSLFLAGKILEMTKKAKRGEGEKRALEILKSGKAFEKFKEIIKEQGGRIEEIKLSKHSKNIFVKRSCKIKDVDISEINSLARVAGCPADKYAGLHIYFKRFQKIKKGQKIVTLYAESEARLKEAIKYYEKVKPIKFA
jgi:AMP phosphorylase